MSYLPDLDLLCKDLLALGTDVLPNVAVFKFSFNSVKERPHIIKSLKYSQSNSELLVGDIPKSMHRRCHQLSLHPPAPQGPT